MTGNILSQVSIFNTLSVLLVLCICSQAFKLPPIDLRSIASPQDQKPQLQVAKGEISSGDSRVLMFPEKGEDEEEDRNYKVQLSFRNHDESSDVQTAQGDNSGLERFYKYSIKTQPRAEEVIVFPKEAIGNVDTQGELEIGEELSHDVPVGSISLSQGKLSTNTGPDVASEDPEKNSNNTINEMQSLETLAHMVRQLLFRVPAAEVPRRIISTEPTIQTYDTPSELEVQEQSLYSGPKLRTQSSGGDCPEGLKRTRNGSCQKPSRRLIS